MSVTLTEALDWLRVDPGANDGIVLALLDAAPAYVEAATGLVAEAQQDEPYVDLCDTATKFLLTLWYYGESGNVNQVSGVVDSLLKSISTLKVGGGE